MLVLTRRLYEEKWTTQGDSRENEIVVLGPSGERIVFKIFPSKRGSGVRVGIEAPPYMTILRGEIEHEHIEPEGNRSIVPVAS
jgi:sRNA-binding carbon storage regulator CsrA